MTTASIQGQQEQAVCFTVAKNKTKEPLRECVRAALDNYFGYLDGHQTADLYQLVLAEVEQPLIETVMKYAEGNQTRAAALLGISRSTLRKKLTIYKLD